MRAPRKLTLGAVGDYVCENFELGMDTQRRECWFYVDMQNIDLFSHDKAHGITSRVKIPTRWIRKALKLLDSRKAKKMRKLAA